MSWFWRSASSAADAGALAALGFDDPFGSQGDAEAWISANYAELPALGVSAVSLFEEDRLVYGPMSLDPE